MYFENHAHIYKSLPCFFCTTSLKSPLWSLLSNTISTQTTYLDNALKILQAFECTKRNAFCNDIENVLDMYFHFLGILIINDLAFLFFLMYTVFKFCLCKAILYVKLFAMQKKRKFIACLNVSSRE